MSTTLECVAVFVVVASIVALLVTMSIIITRRKKEREAYVDWAGGTEPTLSVLRIKSREQLAVSVPDSIHPHPEALSSLTRFSDAGIHVLSGEEKEEKGEDFSVSDTLRLRLHRMPDEKLVSVLRDSMRHVCVFGNLQSRAPTMISSDGRDPEWYSLRDLVSSPPAGLRVLCRDGDDLYALKTVLFACDVEDVDGKVGALHVEYVPCADGQTCADILARSLEPVAVAMVISEHHPVWNTLRDRDIIWYGYESLNVQRLKVALPFAVTTALDVPSRLLSSAKGRRRIYSLVSFHLVVFGGERAEANRLAYTATVALIRGDLDRVYDVAGMNNFLSLYFPFTKDALRVLSVLNDEIYRKRYANPSKTLLSVGRPRFNILEQFEQSPRWDPPQSNALTIHMDENVRGYHKVSDGRSLARLLVKAHDHGARDTSELLRALPVAPSERLKTTTMHTHAYELRGVPVRRWDRIVLRGQARETENGTYFIVRLLPEGRGVVLQDKLALFVDPGSGDEIESRRLHDGHVAKRVRARLAAHPKLASTAVGDRVYVVLPPKGDNKGKGRGRPAYVGAVVPDGNNGVDNDGRVTIALDTAESVFDDGKTHPLYYCTTAPVMQVKEQCDEAGEVWDRPCQTDYECPYFQANKNYPNYRGGCRAGHCEMPLGVRKAGFRRAYPDETQRPVCHNCVNFFQRGGCCDEQRERMGSENSPYRAFLSPDYAFELDEFERLPHARPGWTP